MQYLRILSHGQITDLANGFRKNVPFSVYVRPKTDTIATDILLKCLCFCDEEQTFLPVPINDWTPAAIVEIAPNAIDLSEYDVYWGAGNPKI